MNKIITFLVPTLLALSTSAFATQYVYDSFTDSANVPLTKHVGELNSGWIQGWNSNSFVDGPNKATYSTTDGNIVNTGKIPVNDYSVIATIRCFGHTAGTNAGVSGRVQTTGSHADARYFADFAHGVGWRLMRAINGNEYLLGSIYLDPVGGTDLVVGSSHVVELRMVGSIISMYIDNVLAASAYDTTFTSGAAGLEVAASPSAGTMYEMSNFIVASPEPPSPPSGLKVY
jgi:hypothetical protein